MPRAITREQIYSALFDRLTAATFATPILTQSTFAGKARKYVDPAQIGPDQYPFLSQFEGYPEKYERHGNRLPAIRELGVRLWCWARVASGDTKEIGSTYLNIMTEAIEAALQPDTGGYGDPGNFTLGGLVQWCRIEGVILRVPGDTDPTALVCIPIKILWP